MSVSIFLSLKNLQIEQWRCRHRCSNIVLHLGFTQILKQMCCLLDRWILTRPLGCHFCKKRNIWPNPNCHPGPLRFIDPLPSLSPITLQLTLNQTSPFPSHHLLQLLLCPVLVAYLSRNLHKRNYNANVTSIFVLTMMKNGRRVIVVHLNLTLSSPTRRRYHRWDSFRHLTPTFWCISTR